MISVRKVIPTALVAAVVGFSRSDVNSQTADQLPNSAPTPLTAIAGRLVTKEKMPAIGRLILVFNSADRVVGSAVTDDNGSYEVRNIPPDTYKVDVFQNSKLTTISNSVIVVNAGPNLTHFMVGSPV